MTPPNFPWQAWHLATSTFVLRGTRGTWQHPPAFCVAGVALGHIHFRFAWQAWQVWHLVTSTFVLRGRCGTWSHSPSFCVAGVALMASCWLLVAIHHLSHTPSFTHYLCHTQLSRTIFVTHHLSYIIVVRHHLSHTTWSHTHTIFHTPSFTVLGLVSCIQFCFDRIWPKQKLQTTNLAYLACSSIVSQVELALA